MAAADKEKAAAEDSRESQETTLPPETTQTPETTLPPETTQTPETTLPPETTQETKPAQAASAAPVPEPADLSDTALSTEEGIDIDLTILSATLVYSEVYNMMFAPEEYIGKTVKMTGTSATFQDLITEKYYYACVIRDATACCAQGIEYVLTDDCQSPEDYPAEGEEITVTGVFDTYEEGDYIYCTLRNATLG